MTVYPCGIVRVGWREIRIEISISRYHKWAWTVSGAVCRRFESCQARQISSWKTPENLGPSLQVLPLQLPLQSRRERSGGEERKRRRFGLPSQGWVVGRPVQEPDPYRDQDQVHLLQEQERRSDEVGQAIADRDSGSGS